VRLGNAVVVLVRQRHDFVRAPPRHEEQAFGADGHQARTRESGRKDRDGESWRHHQIRQRRHRWRRCLTMDQHRDG
jgi:hypothetical protein